MREKGRQVGRKEVEREELEKEMGENRWMEREERDGK